MKQTKVWTDSDIKYLENFLENLYETVGPATYTIIYEELYNNPPQGLYLPELLTESTEEEMTNFLKRIYSKVGSEEYLKFENFLLEWNN